MNSELLKSYDNWLSEGTAVALVGRQYMMPAEGKDAVIFPPTYARPKEFQGEWPGYNIDTFPDGTSVCLVDSVGSQANRLEPMFKREPYKKLVPQVVVGLVTRNGENLEVNLLDAGHRAADALVRYSTLSSQLREAFVRYSQGDVVPLARVAPTSVVFGAWDSRGTQAKVPRLLRSVIRAYNVRVLHRSATYIPPLDYENGGVLPEITDPKERDRRAEEGLVHNPASWSHGGILVLGEIRRDVMCNLAALRSLRGPDPEATMTVRRYLLGLALVACTALPEPNLREGCELVLDRDRPPQWELVRWDGQREALSLVHEDALAYAQAAAEAFGVSPETITAEFKPEKVVEALKKTKEERKKSE